MRNEAEVNPTAINVLCKLSQDGTSEEHHIIEGIETVPEGRGDEGCKVVSKTRLLSWNKGSIVNVVFQP